MSTGGPDPNRVDDVDIDVAQGHLGDPRSARFGLPSWAIMLIALVIAALMVALVIF
jgi:hypothetical protein